MISTCCEIILRTVGEKAFCVTWTYVVSCCQGTKGLQLHAAVHMGKQSPSKCTKVWLLWDSQQMSVCLYIHFTCRLIAAESLGWVEDHLRCVVSIATWLTLARPVPLSRRLSIGTFFFIVYYFIMYRYVEIFHHSNCIHAVRGCINKCNSCGFEVSLRMMICLYYRLKLKRQSTSPRNVRCLWSQWRRRILWYLFSCVNEHSLPSKRWFPPIITKCSFVICNRFTSIDFWISGYCANFHINWFIGLIWFIDWKSCNLDLTRWQDMKYMEMMPDANRQEVEQLQVSKPLLPPRDTALSQARKVIWRCNTHYLYATELANSDIVFQITTIFIVNTPFQI